MPNWKKVITSGSNAHLNHITSSGNISASGTLTVGGFSTDTIALTHLTASGNISSSGTIQSTGNITSEGTTLTLQNASAPKVVIKDTTNNFALELEQGNGAAVIRFDDHAAQDLQFDSNSDTNHMFLNSGTGFTGLGTNVPTKKLTVAGDISASGFISAKGTITSSGVNVTGDITSSGTIKSTKLQAGNISISLDKIFLEGVVGGLSDENTSLRIANTTGDTSLGGAGHHFFVSMSGDLGTKRVVSYVGAAQASQQVFYNPDNVVMSYNIMASGSSHPNVTNNTIMNVDTSTATVTYGAPLSQISDDAKNNNILVVEGGISSSAITASSFKGDGSGMTGISADAGGSDTQVQFNDGGTNLGGDSGLTYNKTTDTLSAVKLSLTSITASSNISSSETIIGQDVTVDDQIKAKRMLISQGGTFNSDSSTAPFIIQGDTDSNLFQANPTGTPDKIGIGTAAPTSKLTVSGSISSSGAINSLSHITASGNISGSSTSTGSFGHVMIGGSNIKTFISSSAAADGFGSGGGGGAVSAVANGANNRLATFSSGDALNGEANLTFDGSTLSVTGNQTISSHITASQNISASGTIIADSTNFGGVLTAQDIHFRDNKNQYSYMSSSGNFEQTSFKLQMGDIAGEGNGTSLTINESSGKFDFAGGTIETNGEVSVQGNYLEVTTTGDATDASGDTGALRIEGGASIAKKLFAGTFVSSSQLRSSNDIVATTHITASGNISASGDIDADRLATDLLFSRTGQDLRVNAFADLTLQASNGNIRVYPSSKFVNFVDGSGGSGENKVSINAASGHITASGNISASGTITSSGFNLVGSGTAELEIDGHITASGNISSSATSVLSIGEVQIVSGTLDLKNAGAESQIKLYCQSNNAHFQTIKAAPHSDGASNTLTLPSVGTVFSTTDGTQTLTNKTLTSPTINSITSFNAGGDLDIGSHDLRAATLTADGLTSGRVVFAGTNGVLSDDGDLTFATDTLTVTKIANVNSTTHVTASLNISASGDGIFNRINVGGGLFTSASLAAGGGGGGGITVASDGANRVLTSDGDSTFTAEAGLSFDGTTLTVDGDLTLKRTGSLQFNHFNTGSNPKGQTYNAAGQAQGDIVKFGAGSTSTGKLYYLDTDGNWELANASDNTKGSNELLAISLGSSPITDGMLLRGLIKVGSMSTIGTAVYMDTSNGGITQTAPNSTDNVVRIIGYCTNSTTNQMFFNPDSTWVKRT